MKKHRFYILKQWGGLIMESSLHGFDTDLEAHSFLMTQPIPTGGDGPEYALLNENGKVIEGYAVYSNMSPWGWTSCAICDRFTEDAVVEDNETICRQCIAKSESFAQSMAGSVPQHPYCYAVEVWDNAVWDANLLVFEDDPNCVRRNAYVEQRTEEDNDFKYFTFEDAARLRDAYTPQPVPQDIRIAVEVTASVDALTAVEAESRLIEALVEAKGDSVDIKHVGKRNF